MWTCHEYVTTPCCNRLNLLIAMEESPFVECILNGKIPLFFNSKCNAFDKPFSWDSVGC